jgi:hypothetical protein
MNRSACAKEGHESLMVSNFVIRKDKQFMQTPEMVGQTCIFCGAI